MENLRNEKMPTKETMIENFYRKFFVVGEEVKRISLDDLRELKEKNITTENFLDYICQKHGLLLHGSTHEITDNKLKSDQKRIFASDKSAIAIMRSLYSNIGVNLQYSYFIDKENPLVLKIHTPPDGKFINKESGFIYIVGAKGFRNDPEGSWQFIKDADNTEIKFIIETEKSDFNYSVEVYSDLELDKKDL